MPRSSLGLLVVDGYNVIHQTPRYEELVDAHTAPENLDTDPFVRARAALVSDVAAFAHGSYEAVIVYDGAGNLNPEHPALTSAGVRLLFSDAGQSADELIERLVTEARQAGRAVALVTSDGAIRSTVGFGPGEVTRISSALLVHEIEVVASEVARSSQRGRVRLTLEDRIDPVQREKLWQLLGR